MEAGTMVQNAMDAPEGRDESETADERLDRQKREQQERLGSSAQPQELAVAGTQEALFDMGGKKPGTATLTLSIPAVQMLGGQGFKKGDRFEFSGVAQVVAVGQKDKLDKETKIVTESVQVHQAVVVDLVVPALGEDE